MRICVFTFLQMQFLNDVVFLRSMAPQNLPSSANRDKDYDSMFHRTLHVLWLWSSEFTQASAPSDCMHEVLDCIFITSKPYMALKQEVYTPFQKTDVAELRALCSPPERILIAAAIPAFLIEHVVHKKCVKLPYDISWDKVKQMFRKLEDVIAYTSINEFEHLTVPQLTQLYMFVAPNVEWMSDLHKLVYFFHSLQKHLSLFTTYMEALYPEQTRQVLEPVEDNPSSVADVIVWTLRKEKYNALNPLITTPYHTKVFSRLYETSSSNKSAVTRLFETLIWRNMSSLASNWYLNPVYIANYSVHKCNELSVMSIESFAEFAADFDALERPPPYSASSSCAIQYAYLSAIRRVGNLCFNIDSDSSWFLFSNACLINIPSEISQLKRGSRCRPSPSYQKLYTLLHLLVKPKGPASSMSMTPSLPFPSPGMLRDFHDVMRPRRQDVEARIDCLAADVRRVTYSDPSQQSLQRYVVGVYDARVKCKLEGH
eukprot:PhF_6_TR29443/c1_g1_i2/m.43634